jgi:hypothetical protein
MADILQRILPFTLSQFNGDVHGNVGRLMSRTGIEFELSHSKNEVGYAPSPLLFVVDVAFILVVFDVSFPPLLHVCLDESAALTSALHGVDCHRTHSRSSFLVVDTFAGEGRNHDGADFVLRTCSICMNKHATYVILENYAVLLLQYNCTVFI